MNRRSAEGFSSEKYSAVMINTCPRTLVYRTYTSEHDCTLWTWVKTYQRLQWRVRKMGRPGFHGSGGIGEIYIFCLILL